MTFLDAAAQSRTFTRARGDLVDGFRRRELWLHLGWQDIKQRYRRSVLGPFWITIATGTTAVAMGGLYSKLFHLDLSVHLPYVTLGLIIWNLINAAILEGADVFVANEGLIKQLPTPLSVHVYRLVWRQMILFAHNIVIYLVVAIIFPKPWSWADLSVIPALGLIVLNCIWVSLCFGILATRYRDIGPLLFSIVQLLFFMTPIIWNDDTLRQQGAGRWASIVELNPLLHYLDIVRAPLLGAHQELRHWAVVLVLTAVGWAAGGVRDAAIPRPGALLGLSGSARLLGDDHLVTAGGPGLGEDVEGDGLVPAVRIAAVVEVHLARRGVDPGDDDGVVGRRVAVLVAGLHRDAPEQFRIHTRDHLVAAGQVALQRRPSRFRRRRRRPRCWRRWP